MLAILVLTLNQVYHTVRTVSVFILYSVALLLFYLELSIICVFIFYASFMWSLVIFRTYTYPYLHTTTTLQYKCVINYVLNVYIVLINTKWGVKVKCYCFFSFFFLSEDSGVIWVMTELFDPLDV